MAVAAMRVESKNTTTTSFPMNLPLPHRNLSSLRWLTNGNDNVRRSSRRRERLLLAPIPGQMRRIRSSVISTRLKIIAMVMPQRNIVTFPTIIVYHTRLYFLPRLKFSHHSSAVVWWIRTKATTRRDGG